MLSFGNVHVGLLEYVGLGPNIATLLEATKLRSVRSHANSEILLIVVCIQVVGWIGPKPQGQYALVK